MVTKLYKQRGDGKLQNEISTKP